MYIGGVPVPMQSQVVPPLSSLACTAFWNLDETHNSASSWVDAVGGLAMTPFTDDGTFPASATGKIGGALFTAPSNTHRYLISSTVNPIANYNQSWACSFWIRPQFLPSAGAAPGIVSRTRPSDSYQDWRFAVGLTGLSFQSSDSSSRIITAPFSPTLNTWYFAIGWFDSVANTINLQVDAGTPISLSFVGASFTNASGTLNFGVSVNNAAYGYGLFNGQIDMVGFYTGKPTPADIAYLYNAGAGRQYPFT